MSSADSPVSEKVAILQELNSSQKDRNTMILGIVVVIVGGLLVLYMVNKNTQVKLTGHFEPNPGPFRGVFYGSEI